MNPISGQVTQVRIVDGGMVEVQVGVPNAQPVATFRVPRGEAPQVGQQVTLTATISG